MNSSDFYKILETEKNNIQLKSTLNVTDLLRAAENVDFNYLGKHTIDDISLEIYNVLKINEIVETDIVKLCQKLTEFRYVDQIYQIHKGKYVRWIRTNTTNKPNTPTLTNGGIVVDVKFLDNGTYILCKTKTKFIQYKFDDCLTFQKLSLDEMIILQCMDFLQK